MLSHRKAHGFGFLKLVRIRCSFFCEPVSCVAVLNRVQCGAPKVEQLTGIVISCRSHVGWLPAHAHERDQRYPRSLPILGKCVRNTTVPYRYWDCGTRVPVLEYSRTGMLCTGIMLSTAWYRVPICILLWERYTCTSIDTTPNHAKGTCACPCYHYYCNSRTRVCTVLVPGTSWMHSIFHEGIMHFVGLCYGRPP